MIEQLGHCIEALKTAVADFEPDAYQGDQATKLVSLFAEVERLGAAGKILAAGRVSETAVWRRGGWRSASDWIGRQTGADRSRASVTIETAQRVGECPVVNAELRAGRLSESQAHLIVDAVGIRPDAEAGLVEYAVTHSVRQLADECRRVKTTAETAEDDCRAVHRSRSYREWIGRDGAFCFAGRLTPDAGAAVSNSIEERKARIVTEARRNGEREPFDAYAADALVELVTEERSTAPARSAPKAMILVQVSYESLVRGSVADGEVCEIRGVGSIPLTVARQLAMDSIVRVLVTKGAQPMAATPGLRTIPRALRVVLEGRDRKCVVPHCDVQLGLQIDHNKGFAVLGPTDAENCNRLCRRHHDMKTYQGWSLGGVPGARTWNPPNEYLDPESPDPLIGTVLATDPWTGAVPEDVPLPADGPGEVGLLGDLVGAASPGAPP